MLPMGHLPALARNWSQFALDQALSLGRKLRKLGKRIAIHGRWMRSLLHPGRHLSLRRELVEAPHEGLDDRRIEVGPGLARMIWRASSGGMAGL